MGNSRKIIPIILVFLLASCNIPSADKTQPTPTAAGQIWNLDNFQRTGNIIPTEPTQPSILPTSTPQLYKAVDFDDSFIRSADVPDAASDPAVKTGNDEAQWLFFDPVEYSSGSIDILYAVFTNNGSSTWTGDYFLEFFAGVNPCKSDRIGLDSVIQPGERGTFRIPISSAEPSWKSCWQIKNSSGIPFYEFCYNHGNGQNNTYTNFSAGNSGSAGSAGNTNVVDVAAGVAGKEGYFAFQRTDGSAPSKYSSDELSAELVSTTPASGHTFKAYDHSESITVTFRNNGSEPWDSSYSLKFYSGYNWFHKTSFSVPETVSSGETTTITMPIEIIEDNDKWYTCWYLSTPDGKNLSDFCFNYYTKG